MSGEGQQLIFGSSESRPYPDAPSQTVIIPAYNESFRIVQSLRVVLSYLGEQCYPSDVLLVDDGSTDDTAASARTLLDEFPMLRVHSIPHGGKAAAVLHGLEHARGDLILFADADLATPITYLEEFRAVAMRGADVVIGSREGESAERIGEPAFRHFMGRVFNGMVRVLLLPGIHDTQCGFKLFTAGARDQILPRLHLYRNADGEIQDPKVTAFDVELLVVARRLGLEIAVVPVTWTFGERSKVSPVGDTITNFSDVAHVKWNDLRGRYD
ncbi:MAG: glycosyltransferase family 2 protein [Thermomicrobiales bacterium]|nr:glycosyltransferase family 2 protein [Thermomicrobiales bacterium]